MKNKNPIENVPVIFSYTRAQAIEDGVLVDITEWAKEVGFRFPVACTTAVWQGFIVPPDGTEELGQSERSRCQDLLWMLRCAIRASREARSDLVYFDVAFVTRAEKTEINKLKSMCGPGDQGEPVLTIMLPDED